LPVSPRGRKGLLASLWQSSHKFGCPLYFHEEKSFFETRVNFSNRLFSSSVHFCLKSIRGGGGYTIFPSLSFCPIVDARESPAFQLIAKVNDELCQRENKRTSPALIRNLINQLRLVYEEGSASPKDVNSWWGRNVFHVSREIATVEENSMALTNRIGSSWVDTDGS
jgi:hypothetical protein